MIDNEPAEAKSYRCAWCDEEATGLAFQELPGIHPIASCGGEGHGLGFKLLAIPETPKVVDGARLTHAAAVAVGVGLKVETVTDLLLCGWTLSKTRNAPSAFYDPTYKLTRDGFSPAEAWGVVKP